MHEYVTVSEYSVSTGKDPGNIRRMLISGRLTGEKIGKQWVIKKDEVYPKDERVKSGKYFGWRHLKSNSSLRNVLSKLIAELSGIYKESMAQVIMYGSYARSEETEESDVDIALFLKRSPTEHQHEKMTDKIVDLELEHGFVLSVITINAKDFNEWKDTLPFYKNIVKDGVVLWKNT